MSIQQASNKMQRNPLDVGVLNAKALPEGLNAVYLQGELYKITTKSNKDRLIVCAISLLHDLERSAYVDLQQEKRVGILEVQEGKVRSLTIPHEAFHVVQQERVNEIAFQVDQRILRIKDKMILKEFASDEEYQRYTTYWRP